jgi:hypothetical protein
MQRLRPSGALARSIAFLDPRYLARRGVPLAMGAIVCAGGVAVASSRLESAQGPPIAPAHVKSHVHRRHTHARGAETMVFHSTTRVHHRTRATLVAAAPRVRHVRVPVVHQSHRRVQTPCGQHRRGHGRRAGVTGSCAGGRQGILRSKGGGSRSGPSRLGPQQSGTGSSVGGFGIWPPGASTGH